MRYKNNNYYLNEYGNINNMAIISVDWKKHVSDGKVICVVIT